MKVIVPDNWAELTPWQQREIIHIIQNTDTEDFTEQNIRIIQIILMKEDKVSEYLRMRKILRQIPISAFKESVQFLWEKPTLYEFPKIEGLVEPAPRMGDLTIKQFSICDTLMHRYTEQKQEVFLRQLVACLYRMPTNDNGLKISDPCPFIEGRDFSIIANLIDIMEYRDELAIAKQAEQMLTSSLKNRTSSFASHYKKKEGNQQIFMRRLVIRMAGENLNISHSLPILAKEGFLSSPKSDSTLMFFQKTLPCLDYLTNTMSRSQLWKKSTKSLPLTSKNIVFLMPAKR